MAKSKRGRRIFRLLLAALIGWAVCVGVPVGIYSIARVGIRQFDIRLTVIELDFYVESDQLDAKVTCFTEGTTIPFNFYAERAERSLLWWDLLFSFEEINVPLQRVELGEFTLRLLEGPGRKLVVETPDGREAQLNVGEGLIFSGMTVMDEALDSRPIEGVVIYPLYYNRYDAYNGAPYCVSVPTVTNGELAGSEH